MTRSGPSAADAALIETLGRHGLHVSLAQLERWRNLGVVPRNARRHLGRGKGSSSALSKETVELAAAMAIVTRRGRSAHESVLRIFTVSPLHQDLFDSPLKIPEKAIRSSLKWFVQYGDQTLERRIERALRRTSHSTDDAADIIYQIATKQFRNAGLHLEATSDLRPRMWSAPDEQSIQNLAALTIGHFLGAGEVGAQKMAEIITDTTPSNYTQEDIEHARATMERIFIARDQGGEAIMDLTPEPTIEETIHLLEDIEIERIRETRNKMAMVAEMGHMYLRFRGGEGFEDPTKRILDVSTSSLDNSFLLYAIAPIAETLSTTAWHRMSAILVAILAGRDRDAYSEALDQLAAAMAPEKPRKPTG
ncbi:hypothetical protein ABZ307_02900 [Streptomyces griseorubiginosus]|uniref:hypothetical protein n=1 Tax=Streptomyces griseorubiginosus TaxID=67304 RepID=UPI0033AFEF59